MVHCAPLPVFLRQLSPGGTGSQYPQDGIDEQAVIPGYPSPLPLLSRQVRKDTVGAVGELILVFYYDFFMGYVLKSYT